MGVWRGWMWYESCSGRPQTQSGSLEIGSLIFEDPTVKRTHITCPMVGDLGTCPIYLLRPIFFGLVRVNHMKVNSNCQHQRPWADPSSVAVTFLWRQVLDNLWTCLSLDCHLNDEDILIILSYTSVISTWARAWKLTGCLIMCPFWLAFPGLLW